MGSAVAKSGTCATGSVNKAVRRALANCCGRRAGAAYRKTFRSARVRRRPPNAGPHVDRRRQADHNRKAGAKPEAASEPFKRAIASCTRALARNPELEVTFSTDKPALVTGPEGAKARLPEPPRKASPREAAILRGVADSFALRLACHSEAVHRRLAPQNPAARALFDAVEQARVEAIGARRMEGVAANLTAMLDERYHKSPFAEARSREEAPLEDAVAMLARERLTGLKPPRRGRAADRALARLHRGEGGRGSRQARQRDPRPARLRQARPEAARPRSASPAMRTPTPRTRPDDEQNPPPEEPDEAEGEGEESQSQDSMQREAADDATDDADEGAMDTVEAPSSELDDEGEAGDADEAAENRPPPSQPHGAPDGPTTRPTRQSSTRSSTPTSCATRTSCSGCANISTSSCRTCRRSWRGSPTACSGA